MISGSDFLTINEKRRQMGYDDLDSPLADELLIKTGLTTLDMLGEQPDSVDPITGEVIPGKPPIAGRKVDPGAAEGDPTEISPADEAAIKKALRNLKNGFNVVKR